MDSSRLMVYAIEYYETLFDEISDDQWGWIRGKKHIDYFDDECDFKHGLSNIERQYDDYEIVNTYSGEIYKIT